MANELIEKVFMDWVECDKGLTKDEQWHFKEGACAAYRKLHPEIKQLHKTLELLYGKPFSLRVYTAMNSLVSELTSELDFERELFKKQEHTIETLIGKVYKAELESGTFRTMLEDIIELRNGYYTQEDMEDRLDKIEPLLKQFPEDEK